MILVIDDALENIEEIRQRGIDAAYVDYEPGDGQVYKRVCVCVIPEVLKLIEKHFGDVTLTGMGFRLNYAGELPNQLVHYDKYWGTHAMVLYLHTDPDWRSGTAFWQHQSGSLRHGDEWSQFVGERTGDRYEEWMEHAFVRMIKNRAVFYTSDQYHSRFPFHAFGNSPETGRLIVAAFFTPTEVVR
jgi:hypothetical protein